VTTHLENLEKSENSKVVREKSGKMEKFREKSGSEIRCVFSSSKFQSGQGKVRENGKSQGSEIRCVFSSSKYSKTRFSAGALPRTPLGELTMLPQTS